MTQVQQVSSSGFADLIGGSTPVLVKFTADWCRSCVAMTPILEQVAADFGDRMTVVSVSTDHHPELAAQYTVMSLPTLILFKEGTAVERMMGFVSADSLKLRLEDALGRN